MSQKYYWVYAELVALSSNVVRRKYSWTIFSIPSLSLVVVMHINHHGDNRERLCQEAVARRFMMNSCPIQ